MIYQTVLPILGFNDIDEYRLEKIDDIFYRLENAKAKGPSFTLIQPSVLREDYAFDLPESAAETLKLTKEEDALVLNIMILDTPLENSHVNFIAPLIFNTADGLMGQVILDGAKYPDYGIAEPIRNYLKPAKQKETHT